MELDLRGWVALLQGMMEMERVEGGRTDNTGAVTCRLGVGTPRCLTVTEGLSAVQ